MTAQSSTVLVVEDDESLADMFSTWLESEYEVRTAYDGEQALEQADTSVDAVLLDRRMPGMTGDDVLTELRAQGIGCPVAMVTAVEPDFDVLDIGFDEYVVKPVDPDELKELVARLLELNEVTPVVKEYFAKESKKTTLESQFSEPELLDNEEFVRLKNEIDAFGEEMIGLAETALENQQQGLNSMDRAQVQKDLTEWRNRAKSVPEDDPLYREAQRHIDELEGKLQQGSSDAKRRLLEAVADGFVAEGFWIDPTIQRALNVIFHNKRDDQLVVNRRPIASAAEAGGPAKFDASKEVRERANSELERMR